MNISLVKSVNNNYKYNYLNNAQSFTSKALDFKKTLLVEELEDAFAVKQNAQKLGKAVKLLHSQASNELQKFGIFNCQLQGKEIKSFSLVDKNNIQNDYKFNSDGTIRYVAKNSNSRGKLHTIGEFYYFGKRGESCCLKKYSNFKVLDGECNFELGTAVFDRGYVFYPTEKNRKIASEIYDAYCKF